MVGKEKGRELDAPRERVLRAAGPGTAAGVWLTRRALHAAHGRLRCRPGSRGELVSTGAGAERSFVLSRSSFFSRSPVGWFRLVQAQS